ncbi:hypothetical protein FKP32DRAFT_770427 [Trametes sanguinea]|nr:hypothetical protein FKP32DRAFT_770427 [Trametes sanguinea]
MGTWRETHRPPCLEAGRGKGLEKRRARYICRWALLAGCARARARVRRVVRQIQAGDPSPFLHRPIRKRGLPQGRRADPINPHGRLSSLACSLWSLPPRAHWSPPCSTLLPLP